MASTGSNTNVYRFSTKEVSAKSGLIYFGARYYDPKVGRWTTPDLWTWGPDDPRIFEVPVDPTARFQSKMLSDLGQTDPIRVFSPSLPFQEIWKKLFLHVVSKEPERFNRYIYCFNNPINFIDPDGLTAGPSLPGVVITLGIKGTKGAAYVAGSSRAKRATRYGEYIYPSDFGHPWSRSFFDGYYNTWFQDHPPAKP